MTQAHTLDSSTAAPSKKGRILKRLGLGVLTLGVLFVGVGLLLPAQYQVERSLRIDADVEKIHSLVGDLEQWENWAPWEDNDPSVVVTYGEKTTGVGASQSWTSDEGPGRMTFTASSPERGVEYELSFGEEGDCRAQSRILYTQEPGAVVVTWHMSGDAGLNIVGRYFGLLMDSFVGPCFEDGLAKLKTAAEGKTAAATVTPAATVVGERLRPLPTERAPH